MEFESIDFPTTARSPSVTPVERVQSSMQHATGGGSRIRLGKRRST